MADAFMDDVTHKRPDRLQHEVDDFQRQYARELETYLANRCTAKAKTWQRDYASVDAYLASVRPQRARWHDVMGHFEMDAMDSPQVWTRPFHDGDDYHAEWVHFEFLPGVVSRAIVALPQGAHGRLPVVICQHGITCSPYKMFGYIDDGNLYDSYGVALLQAGFAVVAPVNRNHDRNRLQRLANIGGVSLFGLECFKLDKLIDYLETRRDLDTGRLGMSGLSLGGAATLLCTPLIPRIKAASAAAWFNHRRKKMIIEDPRYSCFLPSTEEHAFVHGWLPEFSDSDLVSLICPRPFMAQVGKADDISWWPYVLEEWQAAKAHYERLGVPERADLVLHDSGHEVIASKMVEFFQKWL